MYVVVFTIRQLDNAKSKYLEILGCFIEGIAILMRLYMGR